ncbi:hypothetical protein CK203_031791 [Vitis vinifera]|uniref:Uncharacterized protein n=1 Tax=Vitis vinifera TaxID=29760 RepID=A0A438I3C4_VITVI|nr:hypothetical protein CK203_031791 [Vitis vinifera]
MNFMSYVAEVSREWGEPNARDKGRMTSQPKAKGEMYILNDGMNMKAKIAAMERRLEELEMNQMQEVQAISLTPLLPMPCSICRSYEHLVDECPTIPTEREMFGDCNTYNSNWRDHPNFSWKPQPPQYKQHVQALPQASILEQAMVNLSKFVGDFIGAQKSINVQLSQRINSVESSLIKRMDEVQNDLSQKIDILQDSISRLANLNTVQEKENSPSQPYQNSKGIHVVEAQEEESSMVKEVKTVITLSGKEVDLPTCKLEHKVESETEKEKREEIKGKKKGKSTEKDDYIDEEPQRIVIKEELMKKHMPPPFLQAFVRFRVETKELQPLQEDHSKLKEDFCTAAKLVFCCKNFAAILYSAQSPGPTLGKASDLRPWRCTSLPLASLWEVKDHLEWQVLGERYEPLQDASVINFVDYPLNQGALAGHESAETPIGHESNGVVVGDRTSNQMVSLPLPLLGMNQYSNSHRSLSTLNWRLKKGSVESEL